MQTSHPIPETLRVPGRVNTVARARRRGIASTTNPSSFGAQVRKLRTQQNRTQKDLADQVGITQAYLSLIEQGHREPTFDKANRLAGSLGVSFRPLLAV